MKKILITPKVQFNEYNNGINLTLDINWGKLAYACELILIPFIYHTDIESYFKLIKIDGVIFSGGNDLSAIDSSELNIIRDQYESELLKICQKNNTPTLGVCRGCQFIASSFGNPITKVPNHVTIEHTVSANSYKENIFNNIQSVNSYHNYGIQKLNSPLIPTLTSDDSFVEAFQHESLPIYGLMWHPERFSPFRKVDLELIKNIFH